jgi:imidazolonepropionase-like amidohydrolase
MGALPILREMLANQKVAVAGSSLVAAETADQIRVAVETFGAAHRPFALLQPARVDEALELVKGQVAGAVLGPFDLDSGERDLRIPALLAAAEVPLAFTAGGDGNALRLTAALATRSGLDPRLARGALAAVGARLLGIDGDVGTLEPGRRGDLVILDGDPLDLAAKVQTVLVGGAAVLAEEEAR